MRRDNQDGLLGNSQPLLDERSENDVYPVALYDYFPRQDHGNIVAGQHFHQLIDRRVTGYADFLQNVGASPDEDPEERLKVVNGRVHGRFVLIPGKKEACGHEGKGSLQRNE